MIFRQPTATTFKNKNLCCTNTSFRRDAYPTSVDVHILDRYLSNTPLGMSYDSGNSVKISRHIRKEEVNNLMTNALRIGFTVQFSFYMDVSAGNNIIVID